MAPHIERPGQSKPRQAPERQRPPQLATGNTDHPVEAAKFQDRQPAPGRADRLGSARVLQNFSTCSERQGARFGVRIGSAARQETGKRHPAWRARLPGRGLLAAPTGTRRVSSQITSAAVRARSSGPIQPAAGITAPSSETICGPRLRPARCCRHRADMGDSRHRRSVAVAVGFEPTEDLRLQTLSSTAHQRSPPSASVSGSTDAARGSAITSPHRNRPLCELAGAGSQAEVGDGR